MLSCLICQDPIIEDSVDKNYPWALSCGHVYHKKCIEQSLRNNATCPKCRKAVTKQFRLFPEVVSGNETVTLLQECVRSAELQATRQKKSCRQLGTVVSGLQQSLEEAEARISALHTSNVNYTVDVQKQTDKLNDEIRQLRDDKATLSEDMKITVRQVVRCDVIICNLKRKLDAEQTMSNIAIKAKKDTDVKYSAAKKQLHRLIGEVERLEEEARVAAAARDVEVARLRAVVDDQWARMALKDEEIQELRSALRFPPPADAAVNELARDLELIALPKSRKRRGAEDSFASGSSDEENSMKQGRAESQAGGDPPRDGPRESSTVKASSPRDYPDEEENGGGVLPTRRKRYAVRKILKVVKFNDAK